MHYIIRYGEIGLKGQNRGFFENKLIDNIRALCGDIKVNRLRGRVIIESGDDISDKLKNVFGIVSFSIAEKVDFSQLNEKVLESIKDKKFEKFRVTVNRIDKSFPAKSNDLARDIGALVVDKFDKKVDLENYDLNIEIELLDTAYLFFEKIRCFGGLPVGTEGKVLLLIESEQGIEAAKRVMRRGCDVIPLAFGEFDISELNSYSPEKKDLKIIKEIGDAEKIAVIEDAKALVVEDNFRDIKDYDVSIAVLRPLVFQ